MSTKIVFFSHSSRDKIALSHLKEILRPKCKGDFSIFLSSDGESIRNGSNWVAEVENALDEAAIVFAFISPMSRDSDWLLFEAGYSYGMKKPVIPVGCAGIDIGVVGFPISMLQGFNIRDERGVENILHTLKDRGIIESFDSVTPNEYRSVFSLFQGAKIGEFAKLNDCFSYIYCVLRPLVFDQALFLTPLAEKLAKTIPEVRHRDDEITFPGGKVSLSADGIVWLFDPSSFEHYMDRLTSLVRELSSVPSTMTTTFLLDAKYSLHLAEVATSGRLINSGLEYHQSNEYTMGEVRATLSGTMTIPISKGRNIQGQAVTLRVQSKHFRPDVNYNILRILFDRQVIIGRR